MAPVFHTFVALAAVLSQVSAAPTLKRDSAVGNEVAVSAPNGVVQSATGMAKNLKAMASTSMMMDATSTAMMMDATSTAMMMDTTNTAMMMDATSTSMMAAESTAASSYGSSSYGSSSYGSSSYGSSYGSSGSSMYGSGSSSWGGMGYNSCVQQCMAEYGSPAATYTAQASMETATSTMDSGSGSGSGSGVTHTVIVAPTQGVLRYVPFAVNASIGDTVRYVWGAGPHTVTESSALTPCNASLAPDAFNSGKENKSFVFDKVVNNTDPTFFYCTVPTHCQKGMFGIINPPNADVSTASVSASSTNSSSNSSMSMASSMSVMSYVNMMSQNDSSMAALAGYVANQTSNSSAAMWGMGMNLASIPESEWNQMAMNVMYTQLLFAANPGMLETGQGAVDTTGKGIVIPSDITQVLASLGTSSSTASASTSPTGVPNNAVSTSASATASMSTGSAYSNGSGRLASSTALVGAIAVFASFMML